MIEKNLTNIDRGITQQKIDSDWELKKLVDYAPINNIPYAYKRFPGESIKYDNQYKIVSNTWQQFASSSFDDGISNIVTSSIKYFDENVIVPVYYQHSHTGSTYLEMFQIGFANKNGSGSLYGDQSFNIFGDFEYENQQQPKSLYSQIKSLFVDKSQLLILDSIEIKDFVFFSIKSQYLFDGLEQETFEIHLSKLDTSAFPQIDIEGPFTPLVFIDRKIEGTGYGYILSGSLASGRYLSNGMEKKYGLIDYSSGTILFDTNRLIQELGFSRGTTGATPNEEWKLPMQMFYSLYSAIFGTIPGSGILNTPVGPTFRLKSTQNVNYTIYQCDVEKIEFNYSNNITYRDPKTNSFKVKKFVSSSNYGDNIVTGSVPGSFFTSSNSSNYQNPEAFITTVGLYSDTYDLIAVAKLSKPIRKNYDKKIIINVRLDY
jgi:hypothetical protein